MDFDVFLDRLRQLKRARVGGVQMPYKPLLVAAVVLLIHKRKITSPDVILDGGLRSAFAQLLEALYPQDPWMGLIKPFFLGFVIVTIGCHVGLRTRGGTQGVGRSTTNAVVAASVGVLAVDFFITRLLITVMY